MGSEHRKFAKSLKRTENATRQKAFRLGLSLQLRSGAGKPHRPSAVWTEQDIWIGSRGIQWTVSLFFPFHVLLDRFDFDCFRQELVTRYLQSIRDFCFEARYSRAAKAILRLAHELLSIGAVRSATVLVKVYRDIPKHRSSYRNNQFSEMLIFRSQLFKRALHHQLRRRGHRTHSVHAKPANQIIACLVVSP